MNMETWKKWVPEKEMPQKFYIDKIVNDSEAVFVTLKGDNKKSIMFTFDGSLLSNRRISKKALSKKIDLLRSKYGSQFIDEWSLFTVENAEHLKWFVNECYELYESKNINHYVFIGSNGAFEVLAPYEPGVEIKDV